MMGMWLIAAGMWFLFFVCSGWIGYRVWQRQRAREAQQLNYQLEQYRQLLELQSEKRTWQYDSVTGLMTEHAFFSELENIQVETCLNTHWALIAIELDDFHTLIGGLNREFQDFLIKFTADHIANAVRKIDVLARTSQHVFWLWVRHVNQAEAVGLIAERILNSFSSEPAPLGEYSVHLSLSMGIALSYPEKRSVAQMRNNALYALTIAKQPGNAPYCFYDDKILKTHHAFMEVSHALSPMEIERALQIEYQNLYRVQMEEGNCIAMQVSMQGNRSLRVNETTLCERAWKSGKQQLLLEVLLQHWQKAFSTHPAGVCLLPVLLNSVQGPHFSMHLMQVCQRLGVPLNRIGLKLLPHPADQLNLSQFQQNIEQLRYLKVKITCDFFSALCSPNALYHYLDEIILEKSVGFFTLIDDASALQLVFKPILELCFAMNVGILLDQKLKNVYFKLNLAEKPSVVTE